MDGSAACCCSSSPSPSRGRMRVCLKEREATFRLELFVVTSRRESGESGVTGGLVEGAAVVGELEAEEAAAAAADAGP